MTLNVCGLSVVQDAEEEVQYGYTKYTRLIEVCSPVSRMQVNFHFRILRPERRPA
jgi:hypothetical protein